MIKEYKITFCWMLKLPIRIKLNGDNYFLVKRYVTVEAENKDEAFKKLKGSSNDVLSSVTSISCIQ